MKGLPRTTVWYCTYGDTRAKPTDIWSNNIYNPMFNKNGWKPRSECWNGNKDCHHEAAPRGSRTGTQGLKNNHERSKIPEQLCTDIVKAQAQKLMLYGVSHCAKCGCNEIGFGLRGELCKRCEHIMKLDAM